jgi:predicted nuclease of predicted toxin-antitoxin system
VSVRLYMDMHIHGAVTEALRRRGVDVLTAQEDGRSRSGDPELLDRATGLGRAFVTHDSDLLVEAGRRQALGINFAGVVYAHELNITVGQLIEQLHFVCAAGDAEYMRGHVEYLPI